MAGTAERSRRLTDGGNEGDVDSAVQKVDKGTELLVHQVCGRTFKSSPSGPSQPPADSEPGVKLGKSDEHKGNTCLTWSKCEHLCTN
jgi:hypothetical protein